MTAYTREYGESQKLKVSDSVLTKIQSINIRVSSIRNKFKNEKKSYKANQIFELVSILKDKLDHCTS